MNPITCSNLNRKETLKKGSRKKDPSKDEKELGYYERVSCEIKVPEMSCRLRFQIRRRAM